MLRKIFVNCIIAFILFPILIFIRDLLVTSVELNNSISIPKFLSFLHDTGYPYISIAFLLIILLPFQLIKNYFNKKGKHLSLLSRVGIFSGYFILVIFILWGRDVVSVVLFYYLLISVVITTLLYFFVDRYEEGKFQID